MLAELLVGLLDLFSPFSLIQSQIVVELDHIEWVRKRVELLQWNRLCEVPASVLLFLAAAG